MNLKMIQEPSYPKVNYIGNKEKLATWICDSFPKDTTSLFDTFSGGSSIGYEAKKRGYRVIANDALSINSKLAHALIENSSETLDKEDLETIFRGEPIKGFMYQNYSEVFFFPNECMELDLYRQNIDKLSNEYKKSLAFSLIRRAMVRKMPYSRFNLNWEKIKQLRDEEYSYAKYKRKRAYHNESIKSHFLKNLDEYNGAVFDNRKKHKVYNDDIFNLLKEVHSDIIYLDPPYAGTMNNYHGFYGLVDEYIAQKKLEPFDNNFMDKKAVLNLFDRLFSSLANFKYWILSYNNNAYPSKEELLEIIGRYSDDIEVVEKPHNYQITGKVKKSTNREYLFIIKNKRLEYLAYHREMVLKK
jgi:adenine-specific DNA-methyltransferase